MQEAEHLSTTPVTEPPPYGGGYVLACWVHSRTSMRGGFWMQYTYDDEAQARDAMMGRTGPCHLFRIPSPQEPTGEEGGGDA